MYKNNEDLLFRYLALSIEHIRIYLSTKFIKTISDKITIIIYSFLSIEDIKISILFKNISFYPDNHLFHSNQFNSKPSDLLTSWLKEEGPESSQAWSEVWTLARALCVEITVPIYYTCSHILHVDLSTCVMRSCACSHILRVFPYIYRVPGPPLRVVLYMLYPPCEIFQLSG